MTRERIREIVASTKADLIRKMLAGIASLPLASKEAFLADPRMVAAGESYLRRALEALMDLGRHILAKQFGIAAVEYKAVALRLGEEGVLAPELAQRMQRMAGYRNRMVHAYEAVSDAELYEILTKHLADIRAVLEALLAWVAEQSGQKVDEL